MAGWWIVLLIGQFAALSLVDAGSLVGYQHFAAWDTLASQPIASSLVLLQATVTAFGMRRHFRSVWIALSESLPGWRMPILLLLMTASSAVVGRDLRRFGGELLLSMTLQLVSFGTLWVAVHAIPSDRIALWHTRLQRSFLAEVPYGDAVAPSLDRVSYGIAGVATVVASILAIGVYGGHPHLMDEVGYLFQARIFASGQIALPNPATPGAFQQFLIEMGPRGWYSPFPPGWSAVLVPGVWLSVPWLVNPVLTGANVLLTDLVLQPLYGRRVARLSSLLLALSPWSLFLGMSFMSHTVTLTCALLAALGVASARRTQQAQWALYGGLALGVIASVRQLDAVIVAVLLGMWSIGLGGRRIPIAGTAGLVVGAMITTMPLLAFNWYFSGKPGTFPMMRYFDRIYGAGANDYGFGANRGMGWAIDPNPGHGPIDGLINTALNTAATNTELFGWSVGSLSLAYAFVVRGRFQRADWAMLGVIAFTWLAYYFNWFSGGPDFGARYWFTMLVPLVVLTVRGAMSLTDPASGQMGATHDFGILPTRMLTGLAMLTAASFVAFVPWRSMHKYWHYRGMQSFRLDGKQPSGRALVMVAGRDVPDQASASLSNPISLSANVPIFVRRQSAREDSITIAAFADRSVWLVDGPSLTGHGFELRAGPLSPSEAMKQISGPLVSPTPVPAPRRVLSADPSDSGAK